MTFFDEPQLSMGQWISKTRKWLQSQSVSQGRDPFGQDYWSSSSECEEHSRLDDLYRAAIDALDKEDKWLYEAFAACPNDLRGHYAERGGLGLTWWVFEQNLMLPIFRAWLMTEKVRWDEPLSGDRARPDILIEAGDQRTEWVFEGKWWNDGGATKPVEDDRKKIRKMLKNPQISRGFQLCFWWGTIKSITEDFQPLISPATDDNPFDVRFAGVFPTWLRHEELGYFAITMLEVRSS